MKPDVIIDSETWLDRSVTNVELKSDSYNIYWSDTPNSVHGGELVVVNLSIRGREVKISSNSTSKGLWVKIECRRHRNILIAACYQPTVSYQTFTAQLRDMLTSLAKKKLLTSYIIWGDFNFISWNWTDISPKPGSQYTVLRHEFRDLLDDFGLTQLLTSPTSINNTLDLIATW